MALEKLPKISGGSPAGGASGQVLVKNSATDYDYTWATIGEGFDPKASVKALTTADINLTTGGLITVDGYTPSVDDRILVRAQANPAENGIYLAKSGAWVRSSDADTGDKLTFGAFVFVENGTAPYISTGWVMTTAGTINLGTTPIVWTQFSQAGVILAGAGLTKTGNTIDITDAELVAFMNTISAADQLFYFTGAGTGTLTTLTSFGRNLIDDVDAAAGRVTLNAANLTGDSSVDFSAKILSVYDKIVISKDSGDGIQVDPAAPTWGWHDLLGNVHVDEQAAFNKPTFASYIAATGIRAYQFAVNDQVYIVFHMPHDYVPGTDIYIHAHWSHNSASVTTGSVTWDFEHTYAKGHDQAAFSTPKTLSISQNASLTQYQHMISESALSVSGGSATQLDSGVLEPDGLILVRVSLSANSMDGGALPFLHFVDIHYQSTNIATKNKAPNFYT